VSGGSGQDRRGGRPAPGSCEVPGCRTQWQGAANATKATDPIEKWRGVKMCATHYQRWYRYGDPERQPGPVGGARKRLPRAELIYLRQMVGVPVRGPSKAQMARWTRQERA
jgi:hypothetical protein